MNKIIKNTLILAAITVVSGLVLGAAYEVTKGPIAQTQAKQKQEACQAVYPEADSFGAMDVDQMCIRDRVICAFIIRRSYSYESRLTSRKTSALYRKNKRNV